jgi:hypothetical protein
MLRGSQGVSLVADEPGEMAFIPVDIYQTGTLSSCMTAPMDDCFASPTSDCAGPGNANVC